MKRTIALVLTLAIILSTSAFHVSAVQPRFLEMFCSMCGGLGTKEYEKSIDPYHFYVQECFEYFEPHYHSILTYEYFFVCYNDGCRNEGIKIPTGEVANFDVCHYGE